MTDDGNTTLAAFGGGAAEDDVEEARHVTEGDEVAELVDLSEHRFPDADGTVELSVTQVDYTVEGRGDEEYPVLHVFGRTPDKEREHVRVFDFKPYFYTPVDDLDRDPEADTDRPLREDDIEDEKLMEERLTGVETRGDLDPSLDAPAADEVVIYESIRGDDLVKVFGQTPRDVGQLRDRFDHYEADILFPNRLLIDKGIKSGIRVPDQRSADGSLKIHHEQLTPTDLSVDPRVHTMDIEVDDRSGFPEDGEEPIICLTTHDSYADEYVVWLYKSPACADSPESLLDYEPIREDFEADVRLFDEEEAMLESYIDYLDERTDPDIITGWNCLPADSEVLMADGTETAIRDVEIGDEVVGSEDQQPTAGKVTNKWTSEKEILEFTLADGTTLRSSGDHRVMVGDDEDVDWKRGRDIEPGDYVLKPRTLNVESPTVPTLADLIPAERQRSDQETVEQLQRQLPYGAVSEPAPAFDAAKESLWRSNPTVWNIDRCETAAERCDVPIPDGGYVHKRTGKQLDRQLTERELYLAGLILTDGSISPSDGMRFYNTRKELHAQFPGDNSLDPDGTGCYKQNVLDVATMYAFNGLGIPYGDKNEVEVDLSAVYQMPESYIARFLAGVVDGDGKVSTNVTVAAENRSIGRWYVKLFRRLGIYAEQNENIVRISSTERDVETLREMLLPHMNHSEKVSRLEQIDGGTSQRAENIPYALFEAEEGTDERRIGRDKHRRGLNLKRHETTVDAWTEYVFVQVDGVALTDTETTYDIETTTSDFIAERCLVHNCDDFDTPYLIDRLEELQSRGHDYDLDVDRLSRVREVWRSDWQGPDIKGRVVFDLLRAYKATKFTELESYRLDAVGEQELGVGKERYPGDIGDLWEQDPEQLLEYNLRDVELCVELDRKQDIIAFFEELSSFVGCKLEDAPTAGDAVDMYVLHKAHGEFALPSKGTVESGEEFEGGAVFEPITGVRENVSVLDLASLYPMCMWTVNASPETKVDPDEYDGDTYQTPTGQHFRKEPAGMMREMIDELLSEREEKKELRNSHDPGSEAYETYDRQQASVKVIMNSLYGVSGWDRFRLYDKESAAAVTATGREVISYTQETVNEFGFDVIYGDTDSIMISLDSDMAVEDIIERSFELEERINDSYDVFAADELNADEHRFEIEFEKLYRRFFQAGKKKRYAGHIVWKEGKDVDDIDITGFEYQRSDIAPVTKEVQKTVLEMIVKEGDVEGVKSYVHDIIADFQEGERPLDDIAIPGGIGKRLDNYDTDTAQVRGAKYANLLLGTNFQRGSKPKRLYLKKVHPDFFERVERERGLDAREDPLYGEFKRDPDVICFEYGDQIPDEFEVDWDKMLEKTLRGPIERILEALDISWEEVRDGQEQTGLEQYF